VSDDTGGTGSGSAGEDARLLDELRALTEQVDPVPPALRRAASAALAVRAAGAELGELAFDSLVDRRDRPGRGPARPRLLTFRAPGLTVEVEVAESGARRDLAGRLAQPVAAEVEVEVARLHRVVAVRADAGGRFAARGLDAGPVRLRCRAARAEGAASFVTDWVVI